MDEIGLAPNDDTPVVDARSSTAVATVAGENTVPAGQFSDHRLEPERLVLHRPAQRPERHFDQLVQDPRMQPDRYQRDERECP